MPVTVQVGQYFVRTGNAIRPYDQSFNYWIGETVEVLEIDGALVTIQVLGDRDFNKFHISVAILTDPHLFRLVEGE